MRALLSMLLVGACHGPAAVAPTAPAAPSLADAHAFRASQPRHLRSLEPSPTPRGLGDTRAVTCGACHTAIYEEWTASTHAAAWRDPQFQAEMHKPRDGDVGWMCVNCHTPSWSQLPRVVGRVDGRLDRPVYVDNPAYLAGSEDDGVSCAACHVRDGFVEGPRGAPAPHATRRAERLSSEALCLECHEATASFPELALACVFETGTEWRDGPYDELGRACPDCHMPGRTEVAGSLVRTRRSHFFGGSGIAKTPADEARVARHRSEFPDGLVLRWIDLPVAARRGGTVSATIELRNEHAGHRLPTGDPERFLRVRLVAEDADGRILADTDERIGTVYRWHPDVAKLSDNRLAPKEARTMTLTFTMPSGGATLSWEASKWRISEENIAYHDLGAKLVPGRVFSTATAHVGDL